MPVATRRTPSAATRPRHLAAGRRAMFVVLLVLGASLFGCLAQGGGSDTETLTGRILAPDGRPAAGVEVTLLPSAYDPSRPEPSQVRIATTDAQGGYAFPRAAAGTYNLLVREPPGAFGFAGGAGVFAEGLPADSLPATLTLAKARIFYISLHDDAYSPADSGTAWFPGTDILARCEGVTATRVESLPAGLDDLVLRSRAGWRHDVRVTQPGDSLDISANPQGVAIRPR